MLAHLSVSPDISRRKEWAEKILLENNINKVHPDLLWFGAEESLGIEQARQIKEFLSLKPYQGRSQAIVVVAAENLTDAAQNALLKTIEEPPPGAILILGVSSTDQLLPTILSRCQVTNLESQLPAESKKFNGEIEKLLSLKMEQRFQFVEKLEKKEEFLTALTAYFRKRMLTDLADTKAQIFLQDLIEAQLWADRNVNIRAILEYLMLRMPSEKID